MIAEGAVVGVLLHRHQLDRVVSGPGDAWQDEVGEFTVGVHPRLLAGHAGVAFVDDWGVDGGRVEFMLPDVFILGVPDLSAEVVGFLVLDGAEDAGGDAVAFRAVGADDVEFDLVFVGEGVGGERGLPIAFAGFGQRVSGGVPLVEIADQRDGFGLGCPFADGPLAGLGVALDSKVLVTVGVSGDRLVAGFDRLQFVVEAFHASLDRSGVRFQPWVIDDEFRGLAHEWIECVSRAGWGRRMCRRVQ